MLIPKYSRMTTKIYFCVILRKWAIGAKAAPQLAFVLMR